MVVVAAGVGFTAWQWDWLHGSDPTTTASTTLRNMGLLIAGGLAIVFAAWRGWVAERQSATAQRQAETAQEQADTAHQGLIYDRYQRGAQMLGSDVLSVRMAGIYALQRLAEEQPEQYHIQIMQLFCAFVRNPAGSQDYPVEKYSYGETAVALRLDIQAVMDSIGRRSNAGINIEQETDSFKLDLHSSDLRGARLEGHNLSESNLMNSDLSEAVMNQADLRGATLSGANLSKTVLENCDLEGASLTQADFTEAFVDGGNLSSSFMMGSIFSDTIFNRSNLSGANLCPATYFGSSFEGANLSGIFVAYFPMEIENKDYVERSLTQMQLDEACCKPDNPPLLASLMDPETLQPLVWRGQTIED